MTDRQGGGLARLAPLLRCPLCAGALSARAGGFGCARGHHFDAARQGYVNFRVGRPRGGRGDTPEMVAARERFLRAGHYAFIADRIAERAAASLDRASGIRAAAEIGAGTGYYLERALELAPEALGLAVDASKAAAKRAARAHPRMGAVVADAAALPIRSECVRVALSVFAPREPEEIARVLAPDGLWLTALPNAEHLAELAEPLGLLAVEAEKEERLRARAGSFFELEGKERADATLELDASAAADLALMGPAGHHHAADELGARAAALGAPIRARASVTLYAFAPKRR